MKKLNARLWAISLLITPAFAIVAAVATTATADPAFIQVKGATDAQLAKAQAMLTKAAYETSATSIQREQDTCEFYKPPQKISLFKRAPDIDPCQAHTRDAKTSSGLPRSAVIADTKSSVLYLCKDGSTVADYDFSMGRAGTNKSKEGDLKTPLGKYTLGKPYASEKFGVYIPIGYPTAEQTKLGYTGGDVGIHGPSRTFRCAGFFNVIVDWTQGCLAVSSDILVKEVARFVEMNGTRTITIL